MIVAKLITLVLACIAVASFVTVLPINPYVQSAIAGAALGIAAGIPTSVLLLNLMRGLNIPAQQPRIEESYPRVIIIGEPRPYWASPEIEVDNERETHYLG